MSVAADLPPWLMPLWARAFSQGARLPHAILMAGAPGSGKRLFAEKLAQSLLCDNRDAQGFACGVCGSCGWFGAANHPDMHRIVPASEEAEDEAEAEDSGKKEKKKSDQIRIDQLRDMQALMEISGHQGGRRVVLIDPAEAMNPAAANALLKSLEEPPIDAVFLLVTHAPRRLLPTICSRCQVWDFPVPDPAVATQWLQARGAKSPDAVLGFASGLPLAALTFVEGPLAEARQRFAKDMLSLPKTDPLKLAGQWETWLKGKDADKMGLSMSLLVGWLQRWLSDGARLAAGSSARFFRDFAPQLGALSAGRSENWIACYNELLAYRRVAQHPLNARLFLEDVLLRVARGTGGK
ncbi:DNA polymerase III subunit delta' [Uliginosibacterium sp. H3]|uniref:DNA polymerase III subunit delta n=1 Tax=Uliginosibacterium silvisoli TaxID=3114758 RepID=A0ABU6K3P6_9RHOO|nr:DNA polymerase III subunit delta' [Uliginosibacterium sp. H3]